jgi:hypothetical protein
MAVLLHLEITHIILLTGGWESPIEGLEVLGKRTDLIML